MHSSQINNKSSLSSFTQDLETFENAYSVLLVKAKERFIEYYKGFNESPNWDIQRKFFAKQIDLTNNILAIYRYFIDVNMRRFFNYPPQTEDPQVSEKMISIFISKIREIQLKLFEIMKEVITIEINYNEFANCFVYSGGRMHDDRLDRFLTFLSKSFGYHCMKKEIKDVLQSLSTLSKGLFPTNDFHSILRDGITLQKP
jgi:hypothetical protein